MACGKAPREPGRATQPPHAQRTWPNLAKSKMSEVKEEKSEEQDEVDEHEEAPEAQPRQFYFHAYQVKIPSFYVSSLPPSALCALSFSSSGDASGNQDS